MVNAALQNVRYGGNDTHKVTDRNLKPFIAITLGILCCQSQYFQFRQYAH